MGREDILSYIDSKVNQRQLETFCKHEGSGILDKAFRFISAAPRDYIPILITKFFKPLKGFLPSRPDIPLFVEPEVWDELASPPHEVRLARFFLKNLKEADIFYDIGANYGVYTRLASKICKEVHSFEPLPSAFSSLEENMKGVRGIFLNEIALGEKLGESTVYVNKVDSGSSTMLQERKGFDPENFQEEIKVKVGTLDGYITSHSKPTVVKMDVEGAESLVISGGMKFFRENSPVIAMEVWGGKWKHFPLRAVSLFLDLGYEIFAIDADGSIKKTNEKFIRSLGVIDNFIFKRKEYSRDE